MPIPLGVLAVAGAGAAGAAGAYEWLETVTLGTATASVTFSNLNTNYGSTYQHLQIRLTARSSQAQTSRTMDMRFNGDTGSNYNSHRLFGEPPSVFSGATTSSNRLQIAEIPAANATADAFTGAVIDILDPFETTKYTTFRSLGGSDVAGPQVFLRSGAWRNTDAVDSIVFAEYTTNSNLVIGTRISLYGLRSA